MSSQFGKAWNEKEIAYLKENYSSKTAKEISVSLNRSIQSVQVRASKLGLKKRNLIKDNHDKIRELAEKGYASDEVAKRLKLNKYELVKYAKKHKIDLKNGKIDYQKNATLAGFDDEPSKSANFSNITYKEWFLRWYHNYRKSDIRDITRAKYRNTFGILLEHPLSEMRLKKITREDVQNFVNWYGANRSKVTVLGTMSFLRASFKDALLDGHIKQNPASNIKAIYKEINFDVKELKKLRDQKKWLEIDEYDKLKWYLIGKMNYCFSSNPENKVSYPQQMKLMIIYVALKTGMRFSEIVGLTADDIDFKNKHVNVDKTWDYKTNKGFMPVKNPSSVREINVDDEFLIVAKNYLKWLEKSHIYISIVKLYS